MVNSRGKIIVPDTVREITEFTRPVRPLYFVKLLNGGHMLIDTSGKPAVPGTIDDAYIHTLAFNGYVITRINGRYNLISPDGKILVPGTYNAISACVPGRSVVSRDGKTLDVFQDDTAEEEATPYFVVSNEKPGTYGLLDGSGKLLIPCVYDSICPVLSGNLVVAKKAGDGDF